MFITDFYMALIIGVASTLLFTEKTGITPGGLIAASYLALVFDSPITLALIFLVSFITYWLVNFVLPKFVILYGKRKFTATLIIVPAIIFYSIERTNSFAGMGTTESWLASFFQSITNVRYLPNL